SYTVGILELLRLDREIISASIVATPSPKSWSSPTPKQQFVLITETLQATLANGAVVTIPAGHNARLLSKRDDGTLVIQYLGNDFNVPANSTNFQKDSGVPQ